MSGTGQHLSVAGHVGYFTHSRNDFADRLSIWAVQLFVVAGVVREILGQTELVRLGFYTFHVIDLPITLSVFAVVAHLANGRVSTRALSLPIILIASLITMNAVRGLTLDPAAALLSIRANSSIASVLLLALCVRRRGATINATRQALIMGAATLSILVLLRVATVPNLFMIFDTTAADANDGGRALSAWGAGMMTLAAGFLLSELLRKKRLRFDAVTVFTLLLPVAILLTRQGTALIAAIAALAVIFLAERGQARSLRFFLGALGLAALLLVLSMTFVDLVGIDFINRRDANLGTRQQVWQSLMNIWPTLPTFTQLFGYPAGQLPPVFIFIGSDFRSWELSAHSMYFGSLPMMGYVGLAGYIALLAIITTLSASYLFRARLEFPAYPLAFCIATAILSISYEVRVDGLLGIFVAILWIRSVPTNPRKSQGQPDPQQVAA
ncbi:MAG: hypothetical protein V4808_07640 [Pseudomonadota bacterium]